MLVKMQKSKEGPVRNSHFDYRNDPTRRADLAEAVAESTASDMAW